MHDRFTTTAPSRRLRACLVALTAALWLGISPAAAQEYIESEFWSQEVEAGDLPPVAERLPEHPLVVDLAGKGREPGKQGGTLRTMVTRSKDVRQMVVYGYARLVGYDQNYELYPDILRDYDRRGGAQLHPASARGSQVVGRHTLHVRGFPLLVGGRGQQRGTVTGRAARIPAHGRPLAHGDLSRPSYSGLRMAGSAIRPSSAAGAGEPALHLPPRALPQAVPRRLWPIRTDCSSWCARSA